MHALTHEHSSPLHLVDATMFWNPGGGGGVRRYLLAKRATLLAQGAMAPYDRGAGSPR